MADGGDGDMDRRCRFRLLHALLIVGLTACEEQTPMARPESEPTIGKSFGGAAENSQPPSDELRRRCMEILQQISPVGQPLTPEDEQLAGLIERPGQPMVAIAPLGRPHVTVDAYDIILAKRCY